MDFNSLKLFALRVLKAKHYWVLAAGLCFAFLGLYLFAGHYVQNYSDPVHYMRRMSRWAQGESIGDRAPVYPIVLYIIEAISGPDWIFLSNLPFILLMLGLLGGLTYRLQPRADPDAGGKDDAWLAGLTAVVILFLVRQDLLLQIVNPFREPLALSLVLLSLLLFGAGWQRKRAGAALLAGATLGLATSIRETSLLVLLPLGLWALREMLRERRLPLVWLAALGFGLLLGIAPLLVKNYTYSGQALVPAYSATRVETYTESGYWDIPVPGMKLGYFPRVGPDVLRRLFGRYSLAGVFFLLVGIGQAVKHRRRFVLYAILPAAGLYVFFHMFYNRYMPRYLLAGEMFAVMVMAGGVAATCRWLAKRLARGHPRWSVLLPRLAFSGMLLWLFVLCLQTLIRDDGRTKVWHLPTIRAEIMAEIETPAVFMGHWHFARRMEWMMGQDSYEYTRRFQRQLTFPPTTEERLAEQGALTLDTFADGRHYYINESQFALAANWLERKPVFDFSGLSAPFERYGRRLRGHLYRVVPWQQKELVVRGERSRPDPAVLMLDLKRAWDYSARTFLNGRERPDGPAYPLTNAVQFIELESPAPESSFEFRIESDQPLPPDPYWALFGLNDEIRLAYGMAADHWAWNLASDSLYPNRAIPYDAGQLYDRGTLWLPIFADAEHEVLAEFRFEFLQEHPHWYSHQHHLEVEAGEWSGRWTLPPRRQQKTVTLPLGRGADGFSIIPVDLKTSLPSHETQNTYPFRAQCRRNGFVKLYDTRVFAWQPPSEYPIRIDIGSPSDGVTVAGGFFPRERSGRHTGRWTREKGEIRLKLPPTDSTLKMTWQVLPIRPGQDDVAPTFQANGRTLPAVESRFVRDSGTWSYTVEVDPRYLEEDIWNVFSIETPTWRPADHMPTSDTRELGVFVVSLEITAP